jgi:hypothetical protein
MSAASIHRLGHSSSEKRARRMLARVTIVLSAVLAAMIAMVPAAIALGDQVLELPQPAAPAASADASTNNAASPQRLRNEASAPMPAGLGSIADYENQDSDASGAATATSPAGAPIEHRGPQATVQNEAILGALVLGVIALELTAGNHHR